MPPHFDRVGPKNAKERLCKETISRVVKEMAKPRLAASVRETTGKLPGKGLR
jgi:hypothetical protein